MEKHTTSFIGLRDMFGDEDSDSGHSPQWSGRLTRFMLAASRFISYRSIPAVRLRRHMVSLPSISTSLIAASALVFVFCYTFVPRPLYWQSIAFGSPPVAIRAGMIAIAMLPWIIALGTKANLVSTMTGIGHERLNSLHRWLAMIFLILALVHTVPFYVQPAWEDQRAREIFRGFFEHGNVYIYGSGLAALVPACFLCVHALPLFRRVSYEIFVFLHIPVSIALIAMLFWHTRDYLTSWYYLFATIGVWAASCILRFVWLLNWSSPFRRDTFLVGEDATLLILPGDALRITIFTRLRWRPGQFVYLRLPGVSMSGNHPFTIASMCNTGGENDGTTEPALREMVLVFRPYGGFTRKVLDTALDNGPGHVYRAFLDGPYGGPTRSLASFERIILIAGGSGITAIVAQLLDLVRNMGEGTVATQSVELVWAVRHPETLEWFKEELDAIRECAPQVPYDVGCL